LQTRALIFDIQDLSVQDGPGIRTTVFMKGCPLKCRWCANPEGQNPYPELMHINSLCKKSYNCISACPYQAVEKNNNGYPQFNRDLCKTCKTRECIESCPSRAIKFTGKYLSLDELIGRIKPNLSFYKNSNGGVTFSGGEPFLQTEFIKDFIEHTSSFGLSVGVETCGMFDWQEVCEIADKFDFFYYDLKCLERELHKSYTGITNDVILTNLENLSKLCADKITASVPVVPGFNDTEIQIKAIAGYCTELGIKKLRLLPYHSLGENKYYDLGREYLMEKNLSVNQMQMQEFLNLVESKGIKCRVE
jgi:pyruvate formate lyase activating enzyme